MTHIIQFSGGKDSTALVCRICHVKQPIGNFHRDKRRSHGHQLTCKKCQSCQGKHYRAKRISDGKPPYESESYRRLRLEVLTHYSYGPPRCACCGESTLEFLGIDHVGGGRRGDGSGIAHRIELSYKKRSVYRDLRMRSFPTGFRVLCHNCNQSIGQYGYCPHEVLRDACVSV